MKKEELIYGFQPVLEAMNSDKEIEKLLIQKNIQPNRVAELIHLATHRKVPFQFVPKEKLNKMTRQNHQGVILIFSGLTYDNTEHIIPGLFEEGLTPFLLVLDKVTDVRNLGSIARSAECAGVHAIILPSRGSAMINADAIKTSAGALSKIKVARESNLKDTLQFIKESGIQLIAATESGDLNYYDVDFTIPSALIMGSEENGVSDEYLKLCDKKVKISMVGELQSLNVSVAAGIILFEGVKQRLSL